MNKQDIYKRLSDLNSVLVYCSDLQKQGRIQVFKVGERICINQERGALYSQLSHENNETSSNQVREYKMPASIEAKIKITIDKVEPVQF